MGFFEKWLVEYIRLIDQAVVKYPKLAPIMLMFKRKLIELKYGQKAMA